jgi:hypothetical protein
MDGLVAYQSYRTNVIEISFKNGQIILLIEVLLRNGHPAES